MPQLDPTWFASQLFWLCITFLMLYVALSRWALPKLMGILTQRDTTRNSDLANAERFNAQALEARQAYERALAEARANAQQLLDTALAEHKARADKSVKELDAQIEARLHDATKRITAKKQELMDSLVPTSAELAAMIVEKLTQKQVPAESLKALVNQLSKAR